MILVKPSFEIWDAPSLEGLKLIEKAGRICYKTEPKEGEIDLKFIQKRIDQKHESVLEHSKATVKLIVDRGISHELVRHRIAAYSQESTRYCNYSGGVTFIIPPWIKIGQGQFTSDIDLGPYEYSPGDFQWFTLLLSTERTYLHLLNCGWMPQEARSVLPNSLKTEIIITANYREWCHIFKLRTAKTAHPQMQEIMKMVLKEFRSLVPVIFDDVGEIE